MDKTCSTCRISKPVDDFYRAAATHPTPDGLRGKCKPCFRANTGRVVTEAQRERGRERQRAKNSAAKRAARVILRAKVLFMYGSECACCGETEEAFLTVDHTRGDGAEHRRSLPPAGLYQWLVDNHFPDGFRLLCWNCNNAVFRRGACPHGNLRPG